MAWRQLVFLALTQVHSINAAQPVLRKEASALETSTPDVTGIAAAPVAEAAVPASGMDLKDVIGRLDSMAKETERLRQALERAQGSPPQQPALAVETRPAAVGAQPAPAQPVTAQPDLQAKLQSIVAGQNARSVQGSAPAAEVTASQVAPTVASPPNAGLPLDALGAIADKAVATAVASVAAAAVAPAVAAAVAPAAATAVAPAVAAAVAPAAATAVAPAAAATPTAEAAPAAATAAASPEKAAPVQAAPLPEPAPAASASAASQAAAGAGAAAPSPALAHASAADSPPATPAAVAQSSQPAAAAKSIAAATIAPIPAPPPPPTHPVHDEEPPSVTDFIDEGSAIMVPATARGAQNTQKVADVPHVTTVHPSGEHTASDIVKVSDAAAARGQEADRKDFTQSVPQQTPATPQRDAQLDLAVR